MQKRVGSSISITWHSNLDVSFMINDERASYIFRVALEALNNAFKHSHAQNIEVILEKDADGVVRLQVTDDGIGMTGPDKEIKTDPNHFGWNLMQERATMIGADLKIFTHLGEGTTIILEVQG